MYVKRVVKGDTYIDPSVDSRRKVLPNPWTTDLDLVSCD